MEPQYSDEYWYWYDRVYLQDPNITHYRYDDEKMWEAWKAGYRAGQIMMRSELKKFRCNGFCGEYECNQRQKEDPNICVRLNHRNPAVIDAMEETINTNYELFKDLKD